MSDDEIIKNAFDFVRNVKNKTVIFDSRDYLISKAVLIDSDTTVIIDGITIKQADNTFDNVFRGNNAVFDSNYPNGLAVGITDIKNIKIIGKTNAVISGPNINRTENGVEMVGDGFGWRTIQVLFAKVSNCEVCGLNFEKTRCWAMSFEKSDNLLIHDINVVSTCPNGDGVDIRSGCHDAEIYNISGLTMDDTVACTGIYGAYHENKDGAYPCEISRMLNPKMSPEELSIRNIKIHDITAIGRYHQVICCSAGGIKVHDISIYNCKADGTADVQLHSLIEMYSGRYIFFGDYTDDDIYSIRVNNIDNNTYPYVLRIDDKVKDVWANKLIQRRTDDEIVHLEKEEGVTITNSRKI